MSEPEQNRHSEFLIEKIKERPVNKKKLIKRTLTTAAMAVIFGLIACFTFLVLEPVISNWLYPEEEPQIVVFPEDQEEMSPEEMLSDHMQQENQVNQAENEAEMIALEEEQIQEILSGINLNKDNYKQLYSALSGYTNELNKYIVTVTGVTSNIDWFNNVQESSNQASGVIIANNSKELLILIDYTSLSKAESLSLTFYNNVKTNVQVKALNHTINLAVLSVNLDELPEEFLESGISIAPLGSSNLSNIVGTPVIALGSPMGTSGSLGYGMVSAISAQMTEVDTNYKLLQTDIVGSQNAGGVIFNLQGQVIGIITNSKTGSDMKNMITAYGITELKRIVEKMSNGEKAAYLGIRGVDVTREAHDELGVPYGAYVKELAMDSPAMLAGIQQGDILVKIGDRNITSFGEYTAELLQLKANETAELTVMRQGQNEYKEISFTVVLGEEE